MVSTYPEPTNEQLWAQPPQAAIPDQPVPLPATVPPPAPPAPLTPVEARPDRSSLGLAIASLGIGIPLTAIASGTGGLTGLVVSWIGIVGVNAVYAWSRRGR